MKSEVRIDKWLWAMRVFKTRTIATDACKKGRVTMGGVSVKPSRTIKVGDITVDNQIVPRPEESNCSQLKIEDIDGEIIDIDLSKLATVDCVNYND